ncbi:hypothetical protein NLX83_21505 [Allokutzneria sp. A3M-2-11 16]|uniref:VG15 protein n=1 Tax=Allokutzneria sp. A3M-2-11 16 TaxID=2962043 RepID=UPI0020B71AEC|nr:hypothetical protein [Allokutzneria sp. A3M-2-11 16]MCP3801846.1 hypothetical protein [Allokutzneria sp. A3M-2-11 16]
MATTPQGRQLTVAHRQAQLGHRADLTRGVLAAWGGLDVANLAVTAKAVAVVLAELVRAAFSRSVDTAAEYVVRHAAAEGVKITPHRALVPERDRLRLHLETSVRASTLTALRAGKSPREAGAVALVRTTGTATRLALAGGRATVTGTARRSRRVKGYRRITSQTPCPFCALLVSRGAVYRSKTTALLDSSGESYHDHCACQAELVYHDEPATEHEKWLAELWEEATKGLSGREARLAFARAYTASLDVRPAALPPLEETRIVPFASVAQRHTVSTETLAAIERAAAELPTTTEEWDAPVQRPMERRIDVRLREAEAAVEEAEQALFARRQETSEYFRSKRTPHHRRDRLMDERTSRERSAVVLARNLVDYLRELADGERPEEFERDGWGRADERPSYLYPTDANGVRVPPTMYERHLDAVLDVGNRILADLRAALPEVDLERRDESTEAECRAAAAREAAVLRDLLASARSFGGSHTDATALTEDDDRSNSRRGRRDWRERLAEAEAEFPADWIALSSLRPLRLAASPRAFYSSDRDHLAMPTPDRDRSIYDGGYRDSTAEVVVHEMGHRMEHTVPGLTHLEFTLARRRSTVDGVVEPLRTLRELTGVDAYGHREVAYPDRWAEPYTGKTYEAWSKEHPASAAWEVFQTGLQDTFGRGTRRFGDTELQAFVLGCLATLHRKGGA